MSSCLDFLKISYTQKPHRFLRIVSSTSTVKGNTELGEKKRKGLHANTIPIGYLLVRFNEQTILGTRIHFKWKQTEFWSSFALSRFQNVLYPHCLTYSQSHTDTHTHTPWRVPVSAVPLSSLPLPIFYFCLCWALGSQWCSFMRSGCCLLIRYLTCVTRWRRRLIRFDSLLGVLHMYSNGSTMSWSARRRRCVI